MLTVKQKRRINREIGDNSIGQWSIGSNAADRPKGNRTMASIVMRGIIEKNRAAETGNSEGVKCFAIR